MPKNRLPRITAIHISVTTALDEVGLRNAGTPTGDRLDTAQCHGARREPLENEEQAERSAGAALALERLRVERDRVDVAEGQTEDA